MNSDAIEAGVRERATQLPGPVWDCEACTGSETMELRRSSLNHQFYADDIALKCRECRYFRTHGIPFEDPAAFTAALEARDGRVYDFAQDRDDHDPSEQLAALGYTGKAEDVQ